MARRARKVNYHSSKAKLTSKQIQALQSEFVKYLRPVEYEIEGFFKNLLRFEVESSSISSSALADFSEILYKSLLEVQKYHTGLIKAADPMNPATSGWMSQLQMNRLAAEAITRTAGMRGTEIFMQARMNLTKLYLADALTRIGKIFHEKFMIGVLSSSVMGLIVDFTPLWDRMEKGVSNLADPIAGTEIIKQQVIGPLESSLSDWLLVVVKSLIQTTPLQAIGGTYADTIVASGQLLDAIKVEKTNNYRLFRQGYRGGKITNAFIVGVGEKSPNRVGIYARALNRSIMTTAPGHGSAKPLFGIEARKRFREWGSSRGKSSSDVRNIMTSIWRRGTYGRNWTAVIATRLFDVSLPQALAQRMADNFEQAMGGEIGG